MSGINDTHSFCDIHLSVYGTNDSQYLCLISQIKYNGGPTKILHVLVLYFSGFICKRSLNGFLSLYIFCLPWIPELAALL